MPTLVSNCNTLDKPIGTSGIAELLLVSKGAVLISSLIQALNRHLGFHLLIEDIEKYLKNQESHSMTYKLHWIVQLRS